MSELKSESLELETVALITQYTEEIHIFVESDPRYLAYSNQEKQLFWKVMQCVIDKAIDQSVDTLAIVDNIKKYRKIGRDQQAWSKAEELMESGAEVSEVLSDLESVVNFDSSQEDSNDSEKMTVPD